jgi:hypothetical protein
MELASMAGGGAATIAQKWCHPLKFDNFENVDEVFSVTSTIWKLSGSQ